MRMKNGRNEDAKYFIEKKDDSNVLLLVILRTVTVMFLLSSAILITMSILFRPWKQETLPGKTKFALEFSVFHVCRSSHVGTKCYKGAYDDAPAWFRAFQTFLFMATIQQYLSTFYIIIQLVRTRNDQVKKFWIPGLASLFSAAFTLTAMLILVGYRDFEFMEDIRLYKMGWIFDQDVDEYSGYPRQMAWWSIGLMLLVTILCSFTQYYEKRYAQRYKMNALRHQAETAVYSVR